MISIIALLIGILLPALGNARRSAQRVLDANNQRQIGYAATYYANDNDGYVPRESVGRYSDNPSNRYANRPPWGVVLRSYLDPDLEPGYWWDIDNHDRFEDVEYFRDPSRPLDEHRINYVVNGFSFIRRGEVDDGTLSDSDLRKPATRISNAANAATAIYLTNLAEDQDGSFARQIDYRHDLSTVALYDLFHPEQVDGTDTSTMRVAPAWYSSGPNCLFFDLHVSLVDADKIRDVNTWDDGDYTWHRFVTSQ
ncbi:MAG: hypothetical protein AAGF47_10600 [Planctomycetota bacterium]